MAFKLALTRQFKGEILNDELFKAASKFKQKQNTPAEPEYSAVAWVAGKCTSICLQPRLNILLPGVEISVGEGIPNRRFCDNVLLWRREPGSSGACADPYACASPFHRRSYRKSGRDL